MSARTFTFCVRTEGFRLGFVGVASTLFKALGMGATASQYAVSTSTVLYAGFRSTNSVVVSASVAFATASQTRTSTRTTGFVTYAHSYAVVVVTATTL